MYDVQMFSERIKERAKSRGIKLKEMLSNCDLNVNFVSQMSERTGAIALAKIADYLDCSVDYLLGRVDTPDGTYSINNNTNINGTQNNVINGNIPVNEKNDTLTEQFMKAFEELSFDDKVSIMQSVKDIKNER